MSDELYEELIVQYENATRTVMAQLLNLQHELLESKTIRNPIDSIHSRIKTHESLTDKCIRRGIDSDDIYRIKNEIRDIAGIRIICLYRDDIDRIEEMINQMPGMWVKETKDYVANPKENGYQSKHLIVYVQVSSLTEGQLKVPVEIQIRTLMMQAWSQVEHRSKYKAENPNPDTPEKLREVAELLHRVDDIFVEIRLQDGEG